MSLYCTPPALLWGAVSGGGSSCICVSRVSLCLSPCVCVREFAPVRARGVGVGGSTPHFTLFIYIFRRRAGPGLRGVVELPRRPRESAEGHHALCPWDNSA